MMQVFFRPVKVFLTPVENSVCSIAAFFLEELELLSTTSAQNRLFAFQITSAQRDIWWISNVFDLEKLIKISGSFVLYFDASVTFESWILQAP